MSDRPRSLKQYRRVDLVLWALMLLIFETVILAASLRWFPGQPYTVSLVPAVTAIVLVRWGPWAAIHAVLGGIVLCAGSRASLVQYAVYVLGNCFSLLVLPALSRWRKEEGIWRESVKALTYGISVLLLMQAGRALVSLVTGSGLENVPGFFTTEVITDLFTLVILWIVRRLDGILEDQRHYLRRLREQEKHTSV